jgi:hypothetical protein
LQTVTVFEFCGAQPQGPVRHVLGKSAVNDRQHKAVVILPPLSRHDWAMVPVLAKVVVAPVAVAPAWARIPPVALWPPTALVPPELMLAPPLFDRGPVPLNPPPAWAAAAPPLLADAFDALPAHDTSSDAAGTSKPQ